MVTVKINWNEIEMVIGIAMVMLGTILFVSGYAGFDLGHNLKWINCEFNTSLGDINNWGELKTPGELIQNNINKLFIGFLVTAFGMLWMGYSIREATT